MSKSPAKSDWRESRRRSARDAILEAAWGLVHERGLLALTLRDLADAAGVTTPTLYAYFDSKHAIYDAMFGRSAGEFADVMAEPYDAPDPASRLVQSARRFVEFCTRDPTRYHLLFQRTITDFEPSAESYEPAVRALEATRDFLASNGVSEPKHLDMWTALLNGLADQQVSNDPGGDRWIRLIPEMVAMFVAHVAVTSPKPVNKPRPTKGVQK